MKKVSKLQVIPQESKILDGFETLNYSDVYQIKKATHKSAEVISKEIMKIPDWVNFLFKLRNSLVKVFGLKVDKQNDNEDTFFTLITKSEDEIVMGEDDKHLNFRASIMVDRLQNTISLITAVHFNNLWGRIYFLPVKPFHKIIMKSLLKRQLKRD